MHKLPFSVVVKVLIVGALLGACSAVDIELAEEGPCPDPRPEVVHYDEATGAKRTLTLEDMYRVLPDDKSEILGDRMEASWYEEVARVQEIEKRTGKRTKPSLIKVIWRQYGPTFMWYGIVAFYEECILKIGQPVCLGLLLECLEDKERSKTNEKLIYASSLIILSLLYTTSDHPYTFAVQRLGMKIRLGLCSLVYRKALKLSRTAQDESDSGQIINFLSSDMNRFDFLLTFLHYIWVAPLQLAAVTGVLFFHIKMDYACLCGVALLIIFVPFQALMGKLFGRLRSTTAIKTDNRIVLINEVIGAIKAIKMYTWENIFIKIVEEARREETKKLQKTADLRAVNQSVYFTASRVTLFITLIVYIFLNEGNIPTPNMVFVCLGLYSNVQLVMTLFFPYAILSIAETRVSIKRFEQFLSLKERKMFEPSKSSADASSVSVTGNKSTTPLPTGAFVKLKKVVAKWKEESKEITLNNISLELHQGKTLAIIGPTGAGKGSLLQVILQELPIKSGELKTQGKIVYTAQEPWVFAGSVRENILFGKEFNESWYDQVVYACALVKDFSILPYGDNTLVGEKGNALSGGQKARVNLARAVYSDADIFLLDDPLSAVDAEVGRLLVENCILGILKPKAVILVTHQLQFLRPFDEILLINHGSIEARGTYNQIVDSGEHFAMLLREKQVSSHISFHSAKSDSVKKSTTDTLADSTSSTSVMDTKTITNIATFFSVGLQEITHVTSAVEPEDPPDEAQTSGGIPCSLYWKYISSGSWTFTVLLLIFGCILTQAAFSGADYWLKFWLDGRFTKDDFKMLGEHGDIVIYAIIMGLLFMLGLFKTFLFFRVCMSSSKELHRVLFLRIVRAPMAFFETNPIGRVINRFSKDMSVLDESLPATLYDAIEIFLQLLGVLCITCVSSPILAIPAAFLLTAFYFLRRFYFKSGNSIKRLEGVARGPIFTHLSTTFDGLTTIRAFGVQKTFQDKFDAYQNLHTSVWYLFLACSRTLGIYIDFAASTFVIVVIFSFMFYEGQGDSTVVGLVISSVITLTSMCQWGVRQSAEVTNQIISVERILEYCKIDQEAALESDLEHKPPENWPPSGNINFNKVSLKYREDSYVLKDITCTIKATEKIGIVGRTGAGKSSLITILFRMAEPCGGTIEVDGINVLELGLHDLRAKISIIPQDPVLFIGTLRKNLNPFGDYSDEEIWKVLDEVHLAEAIKETPTGLDTLIAEGGSNFSVGQRQLICLGRVILRKNKILVLDEATANVDPETDALLQQTIRTKFSDCTVLCVAHRLQTVMDADKILVLDAGQIMEFDEPYKLLENPNSGLNRLVQQTGKIAAASLLKIAKTAHEIREEEKMKVQQRRSITNLAGSNQNK